MSVRPGFFDLHERYAALSAARDPLEKFGALIYLEIFRPAGACRLRFASASANWAFR